MEMTLKVVVGGGEGEESGEEEQFILGILL
jgi:hypothetical protein